MHAIVDGDDNGIGKSLSGCLDGFRRSFVKPLPGLKCEAGVNAESICEERACLKTWLCDCHHFAFRGF